MLETRSKAQKTRILASSWAQGQVTWAKMSKNLPHLWHHPWKIQNWKKKLISNYKACWVFWGFEQLFSTINCQVMELQRLGQDAQIISFNVTWLEPNVLTALCASYNQGRLTMK